MLVGLNLGVGLLKNHCITWHGVGVGLDDPQRSLPTPTIL